MKVREIQQRLADLGYTIVVDGASGPATRATIKQFQIDTGLEADGIAGRVTQAALNGDVVSEPDALLTLVPKKFHAALEETFARFEMNTPERKASFIAQCGHESAGFKTFSENLNYSAQSMERVWPKHFNGGNSAAYHRQPEKIANRAYRDRMGNGDEASGDGWKFRGRGAIQLTGKDNYTRFSKAVFGDARVLLDPDMVSAAPCNFLSAGWFWSENDLNRYADSQDIVGQTKRINGGTHGLEDRKNRYAKALRVFKGVA